MQPYSMLATQITVVISDLQARMANNTRDSPYYVFVALCIVVIVVSLIFKMAYFLS
jgi:ABC-type Fe3+-siderophore transport system permease subunit